jgi:uncharacterized membrane protein
VARHNPRKTASLQKLVSKPTNDPNKASATSTSVKTRQPQQTIVAEAHIFKGPIPHPSLLAQYNDVIPDAASRILGMAEREQEHRHTMEKHLLESSEKRAKSGLRFGFILALGLSVGAIYLLSIGQSVEGLATIFGTIATVAGAFIYVQRTRQPQQAKTDKPEQPPSEEQLSLPLE